MKLSFEKKLNFTFLLVFLVLSFTVYFTINSPYNSSYFWLDHTHLVLHKSSEVSIALKEIANQKLKEVISPDNISVSTFDSLKNIFNTKVKDLNELTKDNKSQQVNIDSLTKLVSKSYAYSNHSIGIFNTSKVKLFFLDEENILIIDKLIASIDQEENRLMVIRQQKHMATFAFINKRFFLLISLISVLLIILYFTIRNGQRNENQFNNKLLFANQRIINILESVADPFFVLDLTKKFIYINSAAVNKAGFSKQNFIGTTIKERKTELNDDLLESKIAEAFLTQTSVTYQTYDNNLYQWYDKTVYPTKEGFTIHEKNITLRKTTENELLKTKKLLDETNEIAKIGGWELDLENNILNLTLVTRKILEVTPEYMTDLTTALKFYKEGETRDRITRVIAEAVETGKPFSEELQLISANGNERWVKAEGKTEFKEGKCIRVFGMFQDLTEEKALKDEIKLKEIQFTQAFKYAATGIALVSLTGNFTNANQSLCKILGYTNTELLKLNVKNITYPPDLQQSIIFANEAISGNNGNYQIEKRFLHKDGNIVWGSLSVSLIKDDKGKPLNLISHISDITERKNAEENLQNSEQKFRELFQFLPVGVALVDLETNKFLEINDTLLNISGFTKEEFVLQSSLERTPPAYHSQDLIELEKLMKTGHCGPYKKKSTRKNGEIFSTLVEAIKFKNSNGNSLMLAVIQDINEIELKEQQLIDLNNLLQKTNATLATINAEQAQFSYIVSHDLKEPLRMIINFMDLLQKRYTTQLDEKANKYIDFAVDGGRRMQKMISDLLLYSSTGQNKTGKETIELAEIIKEVELNLYKQINELHASIIIDSPGCPMSVYKSEILRLFQNLISNAIKFRKKDINPIIHISCSEKIDHWLIEIRDNGIGMDSNNIDKVFDVFTRLHGMNEYEGTGIGLAICKKIVQQHNGTIWVASVLNSGSTFYFTLSK